MEHGVMSDICIVKRENGIGVLKLSNAYRVNISDEGLQAVYATYMAEVIKAEQEKEQSKHL